MCPFLFWPPQIAPPDRHDFEDIRLLVEIHQYPYYRVVATAAGVWKQDVRDLTKAQVRQTYTTYIFWEPVDCM